MVETEAQIMLLEKLVVAHNALGTSYLEVRNSPNTELAASISEAYLKVMDAITYIERGL